MQKPARFLLIDDEIHGNIVSKAFIRRLFPDVEVLDFIYPEEGLRYIKTAYAESPVATVIFLDINMPVLNGWQLLKKLEKLPSAVKQCITVFMLSSSIDPKDKQKAAANPFVAGFIEKPLSKEILQRIFNQ
jgi:response regulator RpfG family c-di-GMP phosphodiesterase